MCDLFAKFVIFVCYQISRTTDFQLEKQEEKKNGNDS